jgi:plastocyanin
MRRIVLSLLILAVLAPVAYAATVDVKVKDNFFKPDELTIDKGDSVRWLWRGDNPHNVALKKPGSKKVVRRSAVKTDGKFVHQFERVGTWRVLCEIHPRKMRMKVNVTAP